MTYRTKYAIRFGDRDYDPGELLSEPTDDVEARRLWELQRARAIEVAPEEEIAEENESITPSPPLESRPLEPSSRILGRRKRRQ